MKNNINKEKKASVLVPIDMNNYVVPRTQYLLSQFGNEFLHGDNNRYFKFLEERYIGSVTNKAAIDDISNYIYGLGLSNNGESVDHLISDEDMRDFITDYKKYGQAAFEVIYSLDGQVLKLNQIPMGWVGIYTPEVLNKRPNFFWVCADWDLKMMFKPELYPAFGTSEEKTKELLVVGLKKQFPYFRLPDYQSSVQYSQVEEEASNFTLSWIENGFSAGHVINVFNGVEDNIEAQELASRKIKETLTGSRNAGKFFISYNDDPTMATTIDAIDSTDEHEKYIGLSEHTEKKILLSHGLFPILLGLEGATGFSNNADELNTALRIFYKKRINPMRMEIISALTPVFEINDANTELSFVDFEELIIAEDGTVDEVVTPAENTLLPDDVIDETPIV